MNMLQGTAGMDQMWAHRYGELITACAKAYADERKVLRHVRRFREYATIADVVVLADWRSARTVVA